ncbi:MAG: DNA repair protein RadC [Rhodospirillales bacterium]
MTSPDDDGQTPKRQGKSLASPEGHAGHRQRLRARLLERGAESLADYELLELLLFSAQARGDTKPLAKRLIARFGSLGEALAASPAELAQVKGMGETSSALLNAVNEAARRLTREEVQDRPLMSSWQRVVDYCRVQIGRESVEQFYLLFLDRKNYLIADERHQRGTIDHTPVYPREVIKRALDLSASALILVHNHPSGDPTPSKADIKMTDEIVQAASQLNISVHDHIVIGKRGHFSFKSNGLI